MGSEITPIQRASSSRRLRQKREANASNAKAPYDIKHGPSYWKRIIGSIKTLPISHFCVEDDYSTEKGGFTGAKSLNLKQKAYTVEELRQKGFKEIQWEGR